jgi:hypothetical protein
MGIRGIGGGCVFNCVFSGYALMKGLCISSVETSNFTNLLTMVLLYN